MIFVRIVIGLLVKTMTSLLLIFLGIGLIIGYNWGFKEAEARSKKTSYKDLF